MKTAVMAVIIAIATSACIPRYVYNIGNNFNQAETRNLVVGVSTIDDARALIGEPVQTVKTKEGMTAIVWRFSGMETALNENRNGASIYKETMAVFDTQGKFVRIQSETTQGGQSGIVR